MKKLSTLKIALTISASIVSASLFNFNLNINVPITLNFYNVPARNLTIEVPSISPRIALAATAQCDDGTYSFSQHRSGTCSHHGGVGQWY